MNQYPGNPSNYEGDGPHSFITAKRLGFAALATAATIALAYGQARGWVPQN